jgi:putative SOS response-associated peptidase YedK
VVSRLAGAPITATSALPDAASSNARLVCDFEPGARTRPRTGPDAGGAGQPAVDGLTRPSLRTAWDDQDMCGRYASTRTSAEIAEEFAAVDVTGPEAPEADYNVAPTKPVLAVVQRHPRGGDVSAGGASGGARGERTERSVRVLRWGLVPSWAKDPSVGSRMINARAETAAEKPAFRKALASRRCLMPAAGWYEWQRDGAGAGKRPYFVTGTDGASLAMAGVWEFWRAPSERGGADSEVLVTCAVLTTDAVGPLAGIHHRMPLLLPRERWGEWLDPDTGAPAALLAPPSPDLVARLELRPVSSLVNNVRNQGPGLLAPAPTAERDPEPPALQLDLPALADSPSGPR